MEVRTLLSVETLAPLVLPMWFQQADSAVDSGGNSDGNPNLAAADQVQRWIVEFKSAAVRQFQSINEVSSLLTTLPAAHVAVQGLGGEGQVVLEVSGGQRNAVAGWLTANTNIAGFWEDALVHVDATPNDTAYAASQWDLENTGQGGGKVDADIDAAAAWDMTTGSNSVIVAVVDSGIDYNHPDLAANMWRNPGETPGDGIDNDANGFVDDVYGWDFANNDNDPMDDFYHGTHVAGTIGAVGNNGVGIAGVNWNVSLMALKFMSASGSGYVSDAIEALNYATMMRERGHNIRVTNNSWGTTSYVQQLYDAIAANRDAGILFVTSAGNGGADKVGDNNDTTPQYPAAFNLDNIITVASTDRNDVLAGSSNYGPVSVDLAAPGVGIYSTAPGNTYRTLNGTSMAAPHVAGVAALASSLAPNASYQQVRSAILSGVDPIAGLAGKVVSGGRLNARNALAALAPVAPLPPPSAQTNIRMLSASADGNSPLTLAFAIDNAAAAPFSIALYRSDDATFGGDLLLQTVTISAAADLTVGTHTKSFTIGSAAGQVVLPGEGAAEIDGDYYLLAVADPGNLIAEAETGLPASDNTTAFVGAYRTSAGVLMVHGGAAADSVTINATVSLTLNQSTYVYAPSAVSAVRVRTHSGDDVVNAATLAKSLVAWGGDGNDVLTGGSVADSLFGGAGGDTLTGGAGNDQLVGGAGDDAYILNASAPLGSDTVVEVAGGGADLLDFSQTTTLGVTVNLGLTTAQTVNANLTLTLSAADGFENVTGGNQNDTLTGNALANTLGGGYGNDFLSGGAGNDILTGGAGNDQLVGGAGDDKYLFNSNVALGNDTVVEVAGGGTDLFDFSQTTTLGVTINLGLTTAQTVNANLTLNLSAADVIENVTGGIQNDTLTGNALANTLSGGNGNDVLSGGAGNDVLIGGAGNDQLAGEAGDDIYTFKADSALGAKTIIEQAGGGVDTLDFSTTTTLGVSVDLSLTAAQVVNTNLTITLSNGETLERAIGTTRNDVLRGNSLNNLLLGGAGNDLLVGSVGRDFLIGGSGADTVDGGGDDDLVIAGKTSYHGEGNGVIDWQAINAIMAEWARSDIGYATRIANLRNGGGLNATYRLNNLTVFSDGAVNSLAGGPGLDWFWRFGGDLISDLGSGGTETVN
ncbi:MAG: S8 family serine peptidase [Planctomycetaceae bacterium]